MNSKLQDKHGNIIMSRFSEDLEDGITLYTYWIKDYCNGQVVWRLKDDFKEKPSFSENISLKEGTKQIITKSKINLNGSNRSNYCKLDNPTIVEKSNVNKPKDDIKFYMEQLWPICFPDNKPNYIKRYPNKEDFKVTTVWNGEKAGHMGVLPAHHDKEFKLAVDWKIWHRRTSEDKIRFLSHELTHIIHSHHKRSFYKKHAQAVKNILESNSAREMLKVWLGDINWNLVKSKTLEGPRNQPSEINIGSFSSRSEAVRKVINDMENILDYNYEVAKRFYLNPPIIELKRGFVKNLSEDEYDMINLEDLKYKSNNYDEEKLNEHINRKLVSKENYGFDYGREHLPVIDEKNNVIKNNLFINILCIMTESKQNKGLYNKEDKSVIKIPCIRN